MSGDDMDGTEALEVVDVRPSPEERVRLTRRKREVIVYHDDELDLIEALAGLSGVPLAVARMLAEGYRLVEVRAALGLSRYQLDRAREVIAKNF